MGRRSSPVGLVAALSLVGCRAAAPGECPVVPEAPLVPTPAPTSELPPLVDDCDGTIGGWLSAADGQLVFWSSDWSPDAEMSKPLGLPPLWSGRTIMIPRGVDEWYSTLLPGHVDSLMSVRTTYGEQNVDGRDELVEIDRRTLLAKVVWVPGHRLLPLGRTGNSLVLLRYDGKAARVVAFDIDTHAIVESKPVDLDLDALTLRPEALYHSWRLDPNDGGNEWSGCHGPNDYFLECRGDQLCRARLEGSKITIAVVDAEPCPELGWLDDLTPEQGPWIEPGQVDQRLPVDGRMVHGVPVEVDACRVRANLFFPALTEPAEEPCRVEIVERPEPDSMPWFHELIVGPGCTLSTGFSEHAFALPPERVHIEPLPERGAWRVLLPYPDSSFADGDCRQGELWLRAIDWHRFSRSETWLGWEYGFCE